MIIEKAQSWAANWMQVARGRRKTVRRSAGFGAALALLAAFAVQPALAQSIQTIDPDAAIDGDLAGGSASGTSASGTYGGTVYSAQPDYGQGDLQPSTSENIAPRYSGQELNLPPETYSDPSAPTYPADTTQAPQSTTYAKDDLIGAAEGLFGKGAEGLAGLIEDLLREQGEPNGYIVGREGGGAFVVGLRYGSGTLYHKIEGERPVYWTGPSIGFDAGANAGNTFVLVYNLNDTEDLYKRFPSAEGQAYFVGGFNASYMRWGDIVLIPIRVGAGLRLGINAGYMKFSKTQRWLPF